MSYKRGLISSLLFRIFHLCSNWSIIHDEIRSLKQFLQKNKYPQNFLDLTISKILEKLILKHKPHNTDSDKKEYIVCLPYIGKQTNILKKRLRKLFSSVYPRSKLKTIFKSEARLGKVFAFKDRSSPMMSSLVLYKFTCGCCNASYIGKTKRHLMIRTCEHLGVSKRTGKNLKYNASNATVVQQHLITNNHTGNFNNFDVIGYAKNDFQLLVKEALLIHKLNPSLNRQLDSFKLQLF